MPQNLPSLTGLRWVAALGVFGFHILVVQYFSGSAVTVWGAVFGPGSSCVALFFVLSGFVITWSYRSGETTRFWLRRVARLWPAHLVAVGLALVVAATTVPGIRTTDPMGELANVFLVSTWHTQWWQAGNPVSWSLACEAFFYFVFPFLHAALRRCPGPFLVAVASVMLLVTFTAPALAAHLPGQLSPYSFPPFRLPEFILGIVCALLIRQHGWSGPRPVVAVPVAVLGYVASAGGFFVPPAGIEPSALADLGFALLISALVRIDLAGRRSVLASRPFQLLGKLSFSFYLVHLLVIASVSSPWPDGHPQIAWVPAALLALVSLTVALALAAALHFGVEVPARQALLRLLDPRVARPSLPSKSRPDRVPEFAGGRHR